MAAIENQPHHHISAQVQSKPSEGTIVGPRAWAMQHEARGLDLSSVRAKSSLCTVSMAVAVK